MLVLTRKPGESILIGNEIRIRLVSTSGAHARIAIEAPEDVTILREEIFERIAQANLDAVRAPIEAIDPADFKPTVGPSPKTGKRS